jgi:hypothetical protein
MWATCEIKSCTAVVEAPFQERTFFRQKIDRSLKKKRVKCYILSTTVFGDKIWTLRK